MSLAREQIESIEKLQVYLTGMLVASCNCDTKTPDVEYHEERCRYRQTSNAVEQIDNIAAALRAVEPAPDVAELVGRLLEPRQGVHDDGTEEFKTWEQLWLQCREAASALSRRVEPSPDVAELARSLNDLAGWIDGLSKLDSPPSPSAALLRQAASALSRLSALQADAERYRWLRENAQHGSDENVFLCVQGVWTPADESECNSTIDAAIDAARKAAP